MLPGNVESALLSNTVYRERFFKFKRIFKEELNFPLIGCVQSLLQPRQEDRIILIESFAGRGCVRLGIGLMMVNR